MEYGCVQQLVSPPRGAALEELQGFLARSGLRWAPGIQHTALVRDGAGRIIAAASLEENVIKCVAVDPEHRGEELTAAVLTPLRRLALEEGRRRLFLYTKPENGAQFTSLGFHRVAQTGEVLLMEDRRGGFAAWAASVRPAGCTGAVGAVVMNANPMTVGHLYLVEQAAGQCDHLCLLVVSEDRSAVPAADRRALVEETMAHLGNVSVAGTEDYLISSTTFPDYFLKERQSGQAVWAELDAAVFCRLAGEAGITRRFVGSEPFCPVTQSYNSTLARILPEHGVELIELPRLERQGTPVSATAVRELVRAGAWEAIRPLVPEAVYRWFAGGENRKRFLERLEKFSV